MIGCLWTRVHKQPIIALYYASRPDCCCCHCVWGFMFGTCFVMLFLMFFHLIEAKKAVVWMSVLCPFLALLWVGMWSGIATFLGCTCTYLFLDRITAGLEVVKLENNLRLKIKHNDWLLADTCPLAANHCALF